MSDDSLFREINEDLRREQLQKLWEKYGTYMLAGALAIVLAVAGYKGLGYWRAKQAAEAGEKFNQAMTVSEEGKKAEALSLFREISAQGPQGYAMLSDFRLAASTAAEGKTDEAVAAYDKLSAKSGINEIFRGFAKIQAAMLRLEKADYAEIQDRVGPLAKPGNSWRHSARELLGLAAYRAGKYKEAETHYNLALVDPAVPPNLKDRAEMMLSLIVSDTAGTKIPKERVTGPDKTPEPAVPDK